MIENFANGCRTRYHADEIERSCEEVLRAITHEPMTAKQIAEHGNIRCFPISVNADPTVNKLNYQRVTREAKILIALGLVKKIIEEWEEKVELPAEEKSVMIADRMDGDKVLSYHWECIEVPAITKTFKRSRTLYALVD